METRILEKRLVTAVADLSPGGRIVSNLTCNGLSSRPGSRPFFIGFTGASN